MRSGATSDLGIAVAAFAAGDLLPASACHGVVHLGELGLDGRIRAVHGVLPGVLAAVRSGHPHVVVPLANVREAQLVEGAKVSAFATLGDLVGAYRAAGRDGTLPLAAASERSGTGVPSERGDLAEVAGQTEARAALTVAAAGGHHLLMSGPPGSGKTMLAERLVTILPRLGQEQALETLAVRSVLGSITEEAALDATPPFVAPHHSATVPALVGGGSGRVLPGAVSQANHGVLFLDEAAEFPASVLQSLRQPLESGEVVVSRARRTVRYPARFQLVLATNPCPCGHGYGKGLSCRCRPTERRAYAARLGGPLLDRVDLQVEVPPVTLSRLTEAAGESSAQVAAHVQRARDIQSERWSELGWTLNSTVPGSVLRQRPWRLPAAVTSDLDRALDRGHLTLRGYDRALRVAWTSSDLAGRTVPERGDVGLGLAYRTGRSAA